MYKEINQFLERAVELLVLEERKPHIYGVVEFCEKLARRYGLDNEKLKTMALSHDLFRDVEGEKLKKIASLYGIELSEIVLKKPILLHGFVASEYLKRRFGVNDYDVLLGVGYHTSGHPEFGVYGKALALADSLEFTRIYDGVNKFRELAFYDMELAYREVIRNKIIYAVNFNLYVLPYTVETWNKIVEEGKK
ncbi:bis(5'-nucleosyl)-tetraphosphatase (symmetrical) YqeK [Fervidobacterium sp. 2310opik-2]|uniref:bis(5'-nucleosyl)-tetraphosphatase (symmetrical) YqeK n=1 Tax=Fervidobacterium sp. 2310opik-2 TaxID=1755815 RepID=UPI0013DF39AB|nr:bis(5'-nucleosyl)-tetraphosphatase (symmetrical) YqeK [Fervidobacterium sp. 2310opik-2]KAF2962477.1 phosphohydrolase [Fervidobacterium sp. 2310opik-2]